MTRGLAAGALFAALMAVAGGSAAAVVTYEWVNVLGSDGIGSIEFSADAIVDPANFSAMPLADVEAFHYRWNSGVTIDLTDVATWLLPRGFSAADGRLTTVANASAESFVMAWEAYPSLSSNSLLAPLSDDDIGYWQLAPISLPAPLALLLAGAALLAPFTRRRG